MTLFAWLMLFVIGVFDAREYRIPNYLVLILLGFSVIFLILEQSSGSEVSLFPHLLGFLACFTLGLIFYLMKIMAAGDVKLLAAIGFILGVSKLLVWAKYFAFICFFIGTMYWVLNRLQMSSSQQVRSDEKTGLNIVQYLSIEGKLVKSDFKARRNLTYMPFAPVLIISLAMHQYFQY